MKKFEVWLEGYCATGDISKANFCGIFEGNDFKDAVYNYVKTLSPKSQESFKDDEYSLRFWGCKFFDNEVDARKNFG